MIGLSLKFPSTAFVSSLWWYKVICVNVYKHLEQQLFNTHICYREVGLLRSPSFHGCEDTCLIFILFCTLILCYVCSFCWFPPGFIQLQGSSGRNIVKIYIYYLNVLICVRFSAICMKCAGSMHVLYHLISLLIVPKYLYH